MDDRFQVWCATSSSFSVEINPENAVEVDDIVRPEQAHVDLAVESYPSLGVLEPPGAVKNLIRTLFRDSSRDVSCTRRAYPGRLDSGGDFCDDRSLLEVEELNVVDREAAIVSYRHDTREIQAVGAFTNASADFGIDDVHIETVHLNAVDHAKLSMQRRNSTVTVANQGFTAERAVTITLMRLRA